MRLSFIGMSGVGKSHWSGQLAEAGFQRFCCDTMIAERLEQDLRREDGSMMDMGEWMGFPYQAHYKAREAKYLGYEIEVMTEILDTLENTPVEAGEQIIIDTAGSVIYTGQAIMERLARLTHIVYLDAPLAVQEKMRIAYIADPAPVLWQDKFVKANGESDETALARCYPTLLTSRTEEYRKWADVTLDYDLLRSEGFDLTQFIEEVRRSLPLSTTL